MTTSTNLQSCVNEQIQHRLTDNKQCSIIGFIHMTPVKPKCVVQLIVSLGGLPKVLAKFYKQQL